MNIKRIFSILIAVATITSASAQIFYKIEGNGLEKPSYLFGTHHLAPISIIDDYNIPEYIGEVEQIVGEVDLTQDQMSIAMAMQPHMMAPADSTLSKIISPEDYEIINEEFKKWSPMPGTDLAMFEPMKPMVVSTMVSVGIMSEQMPGFDPQNQLDTYFFQQGKLLDKKITPLETIEYQAEVLFDSTPVAIQAEALVELLKDPAKALENATELNDAYYKGDLNAMLLLSEKEDEHPEFMEALLDRRNADWLQKLPSIMQEAPAMIAVGALHLAGEKGLVEGLRKQGYTVSPVEK